MLWLMLSCTLDEYDFGPTLVSCAFLRHPRKKQIYRGNVPSVKRIPQKHLKSSTKSGQNLDKFTRRKGITRFFRVNPTLRRLISLIMRASHNLKCKRCVLA